MKPRDSLTLLTFALLVCGCASFQGSGDFQSGRQALLTNRDADAVAYFQRAADKDPNYVFVYDLFREGIWTYLGRAQYRMGRFAEARQSLERALSHDPNDYLARLYLGLAFVRLGNDAQGFNDIQSGLQGVYDWLNYTESTRPYPAWWDPLRQIRTEAKNGIDMISGKDVDRQKLIESAEWVGSQMEEEVDRVRRDEELWRSRREFPPGRGGVGIGIGF